jgi:hypothetical protein
MDLAMVPHGSSLDAAEVAACKLHASFRLPSIRSPDDLGMAIQMSRSSRRLRARWTPNSQLYLSGLWIWANSKMGRKA